MPRPQNRADDVADVVVALAEPFGQRVQERSERMTNELRERYGELNVAVDLIRETRDDA